MPKSKPHYKRKEKLKKEKVKLQTWAQRKADQYNALPEDQKMERDPLAPWRKKPEVEVTEVDVAVDE